MDFFCAESYLTVTSHSHTVQRTKTIDDGMNDDCACRVSDRVSEAEVRELHYSRGLGPVLDEFLSNQASH